MPDAFAPHPVLVNGREIPQEAIAVEAQHHPAPDPVAAWDAAARALAIRQLLLDEADRLEISSGDLVDIEGRKLAPDDARIEALLAAEVRTPKADTETCRRYYEQHRERFRSQTLVEASHILFAADPQDDLAMGLATGDARMLIRELESDPAQFAALARQHSACPSREQGGNLGQVSAGQMVKPFEEALFALPENTLCPDPIKTRFGVHVIRSGRRAEGNQLPFAAVELAIADYLEEASYRRALAQYVALLAGQARIEGIDLATADGALVQ